MRVLEQIQLKIRELIVSGKLLEEEGNLLVISAKAWNQLERDVGMCTKYAPHIDKIELEGVKLDLLYTNHQGFRMMIVPKDCRIR